MFSCRYRLMLMLFPIKKKNKFQLNLLAGKAKKCQLEVGAYFLVSIRIFIEIGSR